MVDEHLPRPNVVFFDLFGTVFKWSKPPREAVSTALAACGHPFAPEVIYHHWREIEKRLPARDEYPNDSEWQYWRHYDADLLTRLGVKPSPEVLGAIRSEFEKNVSLGLQEDALPALSGLKKAGARLGVVSNATFGMRRDFDRLKLKGHFEHVVFSQAIAARKPDPHIFLVALSRFGYPPTQAWMVGDDPQHDVRGAQGVGIVPVLVDRAGLHEQATCTRVSDLREVVRLFEGAGA